MARRPPIDRTLREARDALDLEQQALADALGVTARTLSRWEHGLAIPQRGARPGIVAELARLDPAVAAKVADALGVEGPASTARRDDAPSVEALDAAVYLAADTLGVAAAPLRPVLARFLLHLAASGITPDDARARLTAR